MSSKEPEYWQALVDSSNVHKIANGIQQRTSETAGFNI
jgi:hypothetical protein